jgi:hypothetical protein
MRHFADVSHVTPQAGLGALRVRVSGQRGWDLGAPPARAGPVPGFERTFGMDPDRHVTHVRAALRLPVPVCTPVGAPWRSTDQQTAANTQRSATVDRACGVGKSISKGTLSENPRSLLSVGRGTLAQCTTQRTRPPLVT